MARKSKAKPSFRKFFEKNSKNQEVEQVVESYLVHLEKLDRKRFSFWQDFWSFLAQEREKRIDDIVEAIDSVKVRDVTLDKCSRIVISDFANDPLCTIGSVQKLSGGRFNFGNISSYHKSFHCLYLADNFQTAFAEVFHYAKDESLGEGKLTPEEMHALSPGSFSHYEINGVLDSVIDLRRDESLEPFLRVISEIKPSPSLQARANKLKFGKLTTAGTVESLKRTFLDEKYAQWGVWINEPSNSQWFGHYTRMSGVQAVIYPSCRFDSGTNYAIYIDNFENSEAHLELVGNFPYISEYRQKLTANNYWEYKHNDFKRESPH